MGKPRVIHLDNTMGGPVCLPGNEGTAFAALATDVPQPVGVVCLRCHRAVVKKLARLVRLEGELSHGKR